MDFFRRLMTNIIDNGVGTVFCWVTAKGLGAMGIGMLLAMYFPHSAWLWIGWIFLIASLVLSIPVLQAAFGSKPSQSSPDQTPD